MKDCIIRYYEKYQEDLRGGIMLDEVLSDLHCTREELTTALDELWEDCGITYEINMDVISIWKLL